MSSCIATMNRKLEQFYYAHGIDYQTCTKNEDGMTIWTYEDTDENRRILREWKLAQSRRNKKEGV